MIEEIRENISCPQFGDNHYGKWGALNLEQRKKIKYLLNKIDNLEMIENKYIQLQSNWNSLRECIIGIIDGAREELNIIMQGDDLEYINKCSLQYGAIRKNLEIVLDKMNELEGEKRK